MKKNVILAMGLALASVAAPALAGTGFIRAEAGRSDLDIRADSLGRGSDSDNTWGIRGGYWFNRGFAVEGFYSQVYSTSLDDGFDTYNAKLHGVGAGVVLKHSFAGDHKGLFIGGRAGVARGVATLDIDGDVEEAEASSAKPYFGVSAGYDFSERFGLSLNYDRLQADGDGLDVTVDTVTLGAELRF